MSSIFFGVTVIWVVRKVYIVKGEIPLAGRECGIIKPSSAANGLLAGSTVYLFRGGRRHGTVLCRRCSGRHSVFSIPCIYPGRTFPAFGFRNNRSSA